MLKIYVKKYDVCLICNLPAKIDALMPVKIISNIIVY